MNHLSLINQMKYNGTLLVTERNLFFNKTAPFNSMNNLLIYELNAKNEFKLLFLRKNIISVWPFNNIVIDNISHPEYF